MSWLEPYLPQLLLAWSIQWIGVLSPGPGVALILSVAVNRGRSAALVTVAGIASGTVLLAIATVIGIASVFAQMSGMMVVVRIIGAAYLAYLAYRSFRTAILLPPMNLSASLPEKGMRTAMAGFLMQVSNPKAIFFWLAVAAAGGVGDAPLGVILLFVAGAYVNSFIGHGTYALLLSAPPFRQSYMRARRWVEGTLGAFFVFFAFRLATDRS